LETHKHSCKFDIPSKYERCRVLPIASAVVFLSSLGIPGLAQTVAGRIESFEDGKVTLVWSRGTALKPDRYVLQKRVTCLPGSPCDPDDWTNVSEIREHRNDPPTRYRRVIGNLARETDYCFRVRAFKGNDLIAVSGGVCTRSFGNKPTDPGGGRGGQGSGLASVALSIRVGPFPGPETTQPCTGRMVWTFTPQTLTGASGKTMQFKVDRSFSVQPRRTSPTEFYCFYEDNLGATGLRLGTWQIQARSPVWGTTCMVTLHGGANLAHFTQRKGGCKQDATYP
jgi:hypothetical protein